MSVIVKVNFEAIINEYNQMIWCALPNSLNPLSERCTENPEIKKEKINFEYKNKNWYQISGVNIYGFIDYEFNTTSITYNIYVFLFVGAINFPLAS